MKKYAIAIASVAVVGSIAALAVFFAMPDKTNPEPAQESASTEEQGAENPASPETPDTSIAQQLSTICPGFVSSWFPEVATLQKGCGMPEESYRTISIDGVSFDALFGFVILAPGYPVQNWDTSANTDPSTSFGLIIGNVETYEDGTFRDFHRLTLGDYGVRGRIIAHLYDENSNTRQQINAVYRVRYKSCVTDLFISGTGPAGSSSYGYAVFAAAEQKLRDHVHIMQTFDACKQQQ